MILFGRFTGDCFRLRRVGTYLFWFGRLAIGIFFSNVAFAQSNPVDPQGSGVIIGAAQWVQGTLLGTVATVVAVIAVAVVGLLMLTGRINWRYGAIVILGCFILFGAASIVAGIQSSASLTSGN